LTDGDVAVCVTAGGADELRQRTLASLRAHTAAGVAVVELEPGADPFAAAAPSDVIVVEPGCVVAPEWLEGLRDAARTSATTATASAVSQHDLGTALQAAHFDDAAADVRRGSLRLRPRLPGPAGPCVYARRSAIELVGAGEGFARRCVEQGLSHVLADDVLVLDPRPAPAEPAPFANRALSAARRAISGLSVVLDARILRGPTTGTHVHVLELIGALARTDGLRVTAIVPDHPSEDSLIARDLR